MKNSIQSIQLSTKSIQLTPKKENYWKKKLKFSLNFNQLIFPNEKFNSIN